MPFFTYQIDKNLNKTLVSTKVNGGMITLISLGIVYSAMTIQQVILLTEIYSTETNSDIT